MSIKTPHQMQSIVNMDFLRSGAEFSPPVSRKILNKLEPKRKSKHERLEDFYKATLSAHQPVDMKSETDSSAAVSMDAWDGLSMSKSVGDSVPSILNVNFLRSGNEFTSNGRAMPECQDDTPREFLSRSARLERFYDSTLQVHQVSSPHNDNNNCLDCWDGMSSSVAVDVGTKETADSVVNMDFLRSGAEFTGISDGGLDVSEHREFIPRSRNSRLDSFYARTLAVHQV